MLKNSKLRKQKLKNYILEESKSLFSKKKRDLFEKF